MSEEKFDFGVDLENNILERALFVSAKDESIVVFVHEDNREVIDFLYNNNFLRCYGAEYVNALENCNGDFIEIDDLGVFKEWINYE